MLYKDPQNIQEITKEILLSKNIQNIIDILNKTFPNFIIETLSDFSEDYPHFDLNWTAICFSLKVRKAFILLVDDFEEDSEHILIKMFCEILTQAGFVVRKNKDFQPCLICKKVLPNKGMYEKMKDHKVAVPKEWNDTCKKCV